MKAAIFGAGRMGTAIAHAMNRMGYSLYVIDRDINILNKNIGGLEIKNYLLEATDD